MATSSGEQQPLLEPDSSTSSPDQSRLLLNDRNLSPLHLGDRRGDGRPRSIRSLASYGAIERAPSPSPEPLEGRTVRKTKKDFGSRCLCVSVSVLLAVCVYASFVEDFMGDVETAISCGTCIGLLAPLQALAHVGDDAFVNLFVGFCTKLGVSPPHYLSITDEQSSALLSVGKLQIEDADVCAGAVGTQAPILAHDLRSMSLASHAAKNFCSTVFGLCPLQQTIPHAVNLTAAPVALEAVDYEQVAVAGKMPRIAKRWTSQGRQPFQIVHISDVHVDRSYTVCASGSCSPF